MTNEEIETAKDRLYTQANYRLVNALSEYEARFKDIIEQLDEIVFTTDKSGTLTFLNSAWETHTGFTIQESLGQPIFNYIFSEDLEYFVDSFNKKSSNTIEIRFIHQQGELLWFDTSIKQHITSTPEDFQYIVGRFVNINKRVKTANELKENKERFELAATACNDGIWDMNIETNEVYLSPRWKEMLGYKDYELNNVFSTWQDHLHPEDADKSIDIFNQAIQGNNQFYESVHRLKNKSNNWLWILSRGIITRNEQGKPLRIAGSHTDITRLKQIEEQLVEREHQLNTIFNISPDGIVTISDTGRVSACNQKFLEITGFSFQELLSIPEIAFNKKLDALSCPEFSTISLNEQDNFSTTIKIQAQNNSLNNPSSSKFKIFKLTICKLRNDLLSKVIYFQDITIEHEINRMKSDFLSTAAHEFRSPMSSVYGFTELLLTRDFDKTTSRQILQNIYQQSASLIKMLNDLLDLAKIEALKEKQLEFKKHSLKTVIKQVLTEFMVRDNEHQISTYFIDGDDFIYLDINYAKRALNNILSNAVKYSPKGSKIIISTTLRKNLNEPTEIGICVKDNGVGMTNEQLTKIFDRFWRGENAYNVIGTGLGMSLVKEIMEYLNGTIEIESQVEIGTQISLWFKKNSAYEN
ncbi:PAS domain S-box protein [Methylocucumis oryzae]|uniref:histidine kinase n=1 Tax=Methylocucumis oryzae TaxID=1632867 RepID=A0A0F3IG72_9GAMM|nr:PAS domain S-box protein [Methylocucumis oryzae]KJV05682.1 hypothetical protein VZ94_16360 [Methylocucumis oryzae]